MITSYLRILVICGFAIFWHGLEGQQAIYDKRSGIVEAEYGIELVKDTIWHLRNIQEVGEFLKIESVEVSNGELVIHYSIDRDIIGNKNSLQFRRPSLVVDVNLELQLDGNRIPLKPQHVLGDIHEIELERRSDDLQIIVTNLVTDYKPVIGELSIRLSCRYFDVICDSYPKLASWEWSSMAVGAVAGGALLVWSFEKKNQADELYKDYAAMTDDLNAAVVYENYEEEIRSANAIQAVGVAIIATDLAVIVYRLVRNKNNKDRLDNYCRNRSIEFGQGLQLEPYYNPNVGLGESIGLSLKYTF